MSLRHIGVAGYMGAGKSACSRILSECGYIVFDGDCEAKKVMTDDCTIHHRLSEEFGTRVLEKKGINFRELGRIVFNDNEKLQRLNAIVHPVLLKRLHNMIFMRKDEAVIVIDAALIPLWGIDSWFDMRLWVHATSEVRFYRLSEKLPELSGREIARRMKSQEHLFNPPSRDRWVYIDNNDDLSLLKMRVLEGVGR